MSVDRKRYEELFDKEQDEELSDKEYHELDSLRSALDFEQAMSVPRPKCCKEAQEYPAITFSVDYDKDPVEGKWYISTNEHLCSRLSIRNRFFYENRPAPKFCPYCGTPLPEMIRKDPVPENICVITDGGYYCDTCEERLSSCKCLAPSSAFEEKKNE